MTKDAIKKLMDSIADANDQRFKNPIELVHAVALRVRSNKMPKPTEIGGRWMDPGCGVPVNQNGDPLTWKGNKSIYDSEWLKHWQEHSPKLADQMFMYLCMNREFRYLSNGRYNFEVLGRLGVKFADPVFCAVNGVIPGKISELGYVIGAKVGPCTISRAMASATAEMAYEYANGVDGKPDDVTRRGACKSAEMALKYTLHVDQQFNPMTCGAIAREPRFWGQYANKCKEARPLFEPRITDADTMVRYVNDCPHAESKEHVINAIGLVDWSVFKSILPAIPDPDIRAAVVKKFTGAEAHNMRAVVEIAQRMGDKDPVFMQMILDKGGPDDACVYAASMGVSNDNLRVAASKRPEWANRYSEVIDKKRHPVTEASVCTKARWAFKYANAVDRAWHQVTAEGASYDEDYERMYKQNIKKETPNE